MSEREALKRDFLARAGWSKAAVAPLAGDASGRSYLRLTGRDGARAILMDAPPAAGEDVRPFLAVANHLRGLGLSAPSVMAADENSGFLLLEDLGDGLFARIAEREPRRERDLYLAAVRVLVHIRAAPEPAGLARYDPARLAEFAALSAETYAGHDPTGFAAALQPHFSRLDGPYSLSLRDFHAENLLWLEDRRGLARVGLLDFQDALMAHPAFDLVSLLEDARRDVSPETVDACRTLWLEETGDDPHRFETDYALCGAQRNLRILGVFARLAQAKGKPRYLDLVPRVWGHLMRDLSTPGLEDLRRIVLETIPPPSPDHLSALGQAT